MNPIFIWLIAYCAPALVAAVLPFFLNSNRILTTKIAHVFVVVSILISLYLIHSLGLNFPWPESFLPVAAYIFTIIVSVAIIGKIGIIYGISALLQELTMVLISFILMQSIPFFFVMLMIVPLFVLGHELENPHRCLKITILSGGGAMSLYLFSQSVNIFYITALHVLIGTWLVKTALIYRFRGKT